MPINFVTGLPRQGKTLWTIVTVKARAEKVSIHTRHYWRVNPAITNLMRARTEVSIHTRHYWRVNLDELPDDSTKLPVSIHTRHYWRVNHSRVSNEHV